MIKTIIFDLDRTLLNLDISEAKSLENLFLNHFNTNGVNFDTFFKTYRKHNDIWWFKKSRYEANQTEVKQNRFRDTLNELKITTELSLQEVSDLYFLEAKNYWQLYEGVEEILKYCSEKYAVGMITNGFTKTQNQKIEHLNISHYFNYICMSEQVGFSKPDKRIFKHTLDKLNANNDTTVFIGDDYDNDILGSINFGITPIWFNPEGQRNQENVIEFSHYNEFKKILNNL